VSQGNSEGRKYALLIGLSEYHPDSGLPNLRCPKNGVEALSEVLKNPHIGGFDDNDVESLLDPTVGEMQSSIAELFAKCRRNDLVLLYFTGHGITDQNGHFFFPTRETRKLKDSSNFNPGLAVSASFVRDDVMHRCLSQRQVIILDCCFGGAFLTGTHRMGNQVDMKAELGGEGRAILTAANARGFALELEGEDLSAYTRYLVKGLETGAAAPGDQELIRAEDLSKYIREQLRSSDVTASMSPGSHPADDGDEIVIARVAPVRRYRNMVLEYLQNGQISPIRQATLKAKAEKWGISPETETEILEELSPRTPPSLPAPPSRKLDEYAEVVRQEVDRCNPLSERTSEELRDYQKALDLRDEDVAPIHDRLGAIFFIQPIAVEPILPDVEPIVLPSVAEPLEQLPPDEPLDVSGTQDPGNSQPRRNFSNRFLLLGIVPFLLWGIKQCLNLTQPPVIQPSSNSQLIPIGQLISAGDNENLYGSRSRSGGYDISAKDSINNAIKLFRDGEYQKAYDAFAKIRKDASDEIANDPNKEDPLKKKNNDSSPIKDPEILIFQNNAKARLNHEKGIGSPIYTIAAAVPLSNADGTPFDKGQQMLFGIAQEQAKAVENRDSPINLEVVIANDLNTPGQASKLAEELIKPSIKVSDKIDRTILAVIGHYTSTVTCAALSIYDGAKLPIISPTSTLTDMRGTCGGDKKNDVFFRTASSSEKEATSLKDYLANHEVSNLKIAVFYKKDDPFSEDLLAQFKKVLKDINYKISDSDIFTLNSKGDAKESEKRLVGANYNVLAVFPDGSTDNSLAFSNAVSIIQSSAAKDYLILGSNPFSSSPNPALNISDTGKGLVISIDWIASCSATSFFDDAKTRWAGPPNRITALSYEAVQVLVSNLKEPVNRDSILHGMKNRTDPVRSDVFKDSRKISFDNKGDRREIQSRILLTPSQTKNPETGEMFSPLTPDVCK
jgi:branched-chain amino acid transport system substrate-binding protein